MNRMILTARSIRTGLALLLLTLVCRWAVCQEVLYSTHFEVSEGFDPSLTLIGQDGWVGSGTGGNGLTTNLFEGLGQQAYVGFTPPEGTDAVLSVFRPINYVPPPTHPVVKFSVLMQVANSNSTNGPWDDFRWSIYNTNTNRLFSLDFDNSTLQISYLLDDGKDPVPTHIGFDNNGSYDLVVTMDFARNFWTATLNEQVIVNGQPITTQGSPLSFGDADAVWVVRTPGHAGDNFLLFDNYQVTHPADASIPPQFELLGRRSDGVFQARIYGEPGLSYRIDTSADLISWQPLITLTAAADGTINFQDPASTGLSRRFYRAVQTQ